MPSFKTVFLLATATLSAFAAANPSQPNLENEQELKWTKDKFKFENEQEAKAGKYKFENEQEVKVTKDKAKVENEQEIKGPGFKAENEQEVKATKDGVEVENEQELELGKRCAGCWTIPGILEDVHQQVTTISDRLSAVVRVNAAVDIAVVTPHLYDLKGVLVNAVSQVNSISKQPLDVILAKDGARITVSACANDLFNLFALVCSVLSVSFHAVATVHATAVLAVIAQLSAVLAELLTVVFTIVADLHVAFCQLLKVDVSIVAIVRLLKLVDIIALVKGNVAI